MMNNSTDQNKTAFNKSKGASLNQIISRDFVKEIGRGKFPEWIKEFASVR